MKLWGVVLILAAVVAYALVYEQEKSLTPDETLVQWSADAVQRIRLESGFQPTVELVKQGDQWQVQPGDAVAKPARPDLVERLLLDLSTMQVMRIVARGSKHDAELGLDSSGRVALTLMDQSGSDLLSLVIGKQGSDLLSTYVRYQGQQQVVAVDKSLIWQVRRTADGWKQPESAAEQVQEAVVDPYGVTNPYGQTMEAAGGESH